MVDRNHSNDSMRKPVVLVLGPALHLISGVSTHVKLLLSSELARSHKIVHFEVGSLPCEPWSKKTRRILISPFYLALNIVTHKPTIVHLNPSLNRKAFWRDFVYLAVAKLCGAKTIYQVHGGSLATFHARRRWLSPAIRVVGRMADRIVVLSEREKKNFANYVASKKLIIIPNAIDLSEHEGWMEKRFDFDHHHLGYLGRLVPDKGVFEIIEAMSVLRNKGRRLTLHIAGSGPSESAMKERVARLNLSADVRFRGELHGGDKIEFWKHLHVFVFPSYHEGLPYALLESLASGTPIVTTPVGAIPEIIEDGTHGLCVPTRDIAGIVNAIESLLDSPQRLRCMSSACRKRAESMYGLPRLTAQFAELYSDLISTTASSAGNLIR